MGFGIFGSDYWYWHILSLHQKWHDLKNEKIDTENEEAQEHGEAEEWLVFFAPFLDTVDGFCAGLDTRADCEERYYNYDTVKSDSKELPLWSNCIDAARSEDKEDESKW